MYALLVLPAHDSALATGDGEVLATATWRAVGRDIRQLCDAEPLAGPTELLADRAAEPANDGGVQCSCASKRHTGLSLHQDAGVATDGK